MGTLVFPEMNYTYVGHWKNNTMDGFGKYNRTDINNKESHVYEGQFQNGLFHGSVSISKKGHMSGIRNSGQKVYYFWSSRPKIVLL